MTRTDTPSLSPPSVLNVVVLGSGSSGNSTAIESGGTLVLVDCGFSARETASRLTAAGLDPSRVSAILVTHEHGDHVRGVDVFARRHAPECAVYATAGTLGAMSIGHTIERHRIRPGEEIAVGSLRVVAFSTSHDATQPVGYRIDCGEEVFGIATDSGVLTPAAVDSLKDATVLGLEFNHDIEMLERGPYPYHLKQRILSHRGHLSNADAAQAVERPAHGRLRRVIALHRSRTNNTAALAGEALRAALDRACHPAHAEVAEQHRPTPPPAGQTLARD